MCQKISCTFFYDFWKHVSSGQSGFKTISLNPEDDGNMLQIIFEEFNQKPQMNIMNVKQDEKFRHNVQIFLDG